MNISDIIIHINENLSTEQRSSLEDNMRQIDGVVSPRFNQGKEHFLVVAYDTEKTARIRHRSALAFLLLTGALALVLLIEFDTALLAQFDQISNRLHG